MLRADTIFLFMHEKHQTDIQLNRLKTLRFFTIYALQSWISFSHKKSSYHQSVGAFFTDKNTRL